MASRISHTARRRSRSRWRLMVTRASGIAIVLRMSMMMVAMINSIRVKPCCDFAALDETVGPPNRRCFVVNAILLPKAPQLRY